MKLFQTVFLILILAVLVQSESKNDNTLSAVKICSLTPNPGYGDCNSEPVVMFYFDRYERKCKTFLSLNCKERNANRFHTEEECVRMCYYTACYPGEIIARSNATTPIPCGKLSQCPDGYRCSFDELFHRRVCCGYSNLEGACPENSVSIASPNEFSPYQCSPSTATEQCPMDFICIKKEKSGHCCKPRKDYCPLGQKPLTDTVSKRPMKCNLMRNQSICSDGYECISPYQGSPWGFCCSSKIEGRCPNGTQLYLYPENGQPQKCTVGVTTCTVGYSCQGEDNSIVGFCCTKPSRSKKDAGTNVETPLWFTTEHHFANEGLVHKKDKRTSTASTHSYAYDLMTVLSCPNELTPSYMAGSQIIVECTEADNLTISCPAPAVCVRAPRDVLGRKVCCSD